MCRNSKSVYLQCFCDDIKKHWNYGNIYMSSTTVLYIEIQFHKSESLQFFFPMTSVTPLSTLTCYKSCSNFFTSAVRSTSDRFFVFSAAEPEMRSEGTFHHALIKCCCITSGVKFEEAISEFPLAPVSKRG